MTADPPRPRAPGRSGRSGRSGPIAPVAGLLSLTRRPWFRWGFLLLAVGLAGWALAARREEVAAALARLDLRFVAAAAAVTTVQLALTGLAWRTLLADLGSPLPLPVAARVFFVGQIGKYVPGSVWPVVMQAELARDHGVPRRRTAAATMVMLLLAAATALMVAMAAFPFVPQVATGRYGWMLLLVVPLVVALHPRLLGPVLDRVLGVIGGEPLEHPPSARGTATATAWALASWLAAGAQVWLLAGALGADLTWRTFALAAGGYAFAWAVGMLVVVAPAGAGAREVALIAALSSVVGGGGAVLVLVLASRVLFTLADLLAAGIGHGAGRLPPSP